MRISISTFSDFVNKTGRSKTGVVRNAKESGVYDYWMPVRNGIVSVQRRGGDPKELNTLLESAPPDRVNNYGICVKAFQKWHKGKEFGPRRIRQAGRWEVGELEVTIPADLIQSIDGDDRVTRLYFSEPTIKPAQRLAMLYLLAYAYPDNGVPTVFEVRKGKLHDEKPEIIAAQAALLEGEAETFARIWNSL